jgi:hypothetical protein
MELYGFNRYNVYMSDVIKNHQMLQESYRQKDLFDFTQYADNLDSTLSSNKSPTVTALIGGYGTGKTVLTNMVHDKHPTVKWLDFDAWKYPDKKNLWEAFILELTEVVDKSLLPENKRLIEGGETKKTKLLGFFDSIKTHVSTLALLVAIYFLSTYTDKDTDIATQILLGAFAVLAVILAVVKYYDIESDEQAIHRVSDYEKIMLKTLSKYRGMLYIVIEDVDRAGDQGRLFLETVSNFFHQESLTNKKINVIVPMKHGGGAAASSEKSVSFYDSCQKSIDNFVYFKPSVKDIEPFLLEVLSNDYTKQEDLTLLTQLLQPYINDGTINFRRFKRIIRDAVKRHERIGNTKGSSLFMLCVIAETLKYIPGSGGTSIGHPYKSASNNGIRDKPVQILLDWANAKSIITLPASEHESGIDVNYKHIGVDPEAGNQLTFADTATNKIQNGTRETIKRRTFNVDPIYFTDL